MASSKTIAQFIADIPETGVGCIIWPFTKDKAGYAKYAKTYLHILICESVHGPRPSKQHQAAHSCGNSSCVAPWHLSWKTKTENAADKFVHGTNVVGEKHGRATLSDATVLRILQMHRNGMRAIDISRQLAIRYGKVQAITSGKKWKHLQ